METHRVGLHILFQSKKKNFFFLFKAKPHEYIAQIKLAKQITLLVHGGMNSIVRSNSKSSFSFRTRIGISDTQYSSNVRSKYRFTS